MTRPSRNAVLMEIADVISQRGTCARKQVGCVVARDGRVLVLGYNGAPAGMEHCFHPDGSDEPCEISVHAEGNAIAYAAKHGISLHKGILYTTCSPCRTCVQLIINTGIIEVIYLEKYRDETPLDLLRKAGIVVWQLDAK